MNQLGSPTAFCNHPIAIDRVRAIFLRFTVPDSTMVAILVFFRGCDTRFSVSWMTTPKLFEHFTSNGVHLQIVHDTIWHSKRNVLAFFPELANERAIQPCRIALTMSKVSAPEPESGNGKVGCPGKYPSKRR